MMRSPPSGSRPAASLPSSALLSTALPAARRLSALARKDRPVLIGELDHRQCVRGAGFAVTVFERLHGLAVLPGGLLECGVGHNLARGPLEKFVAGRVLVGELGVDGPGARRIEIRYLQTEDRIDGRRVVRLVREDVGVAEDPEDPELVLE